ncbi:uncharacterized protein CEXT_736441 [Caerostris extrusa]|uniref:Uncharacterized protein n=2 Tax=Caerostris extrusa TaxID=172846 RepID=A0AAV4QTJ3_CAEEX|nr:uncharacterized protein CEXT_736441 [Caerostris extrusa]
MLLEKRIRSPSKEFDSLIKNSESSNSIKSLQATTAPADEILATKIHTHVDENPLIAKIAMASKTPAIEWHKNPQSLPEKQVSEPVKDLIANPTIRKTNFDYEESFLSPPVPCGQVPAKEIHSSLQKHDKKTLPNKLQNKEHYNENMIPEKSSAAFSVFSANCNEKALILKSTPEKEQRVKRKHRSRSEKSGKSNAKKQKIIDIQFSTDQIKNMLDIMKVFHSSI